MIQQRRGKRRQATIPQKKEKEKEAGHNLIFLVGNGQTGTNWLGQIVLSHPNITGQNERLPEFQLVTQLGVHKPVYDTQEYQSKLNRVVQQYQLRSSQTTATKEYRYHSDKSHPGLWIAEDLRRAFPAAKFVGIHRCVYPTVASCIQHKGVSNWFQHPEQFVRNHLSPFLGVTDRNYDRFSGLPLHVQCALRWASHQQEYERLESESIWGKTTDSSLLLMDYRSLALNPSRELNKLQEFLRLDRPFHRAPASHYDPRKWKATIQGSKSSKSTTSCRHPAGIRSLRSIVIRVSYSESVSV